MINTKQDYQKTGWLSVFCGIWSAILDHIFACGFLFGAFDDGGQNINAFYNSVKNNMLGITSLLMGIGFISSVLLIIGGVLMLFNRKLLGLWFSNFGLCGICLYLLSFDIIALVLIFFGVPASVTFYCVGASFIILVPMFFLYQFLKTLG